MKLTQDIINQADQIHRFKSESEIPYPNLLGRIAVGVLRECGWYGFIDDEGKKVLVIAEYAS